MRRIRAGSVGMVRIFLLTSASSSRRRDGVVVGLGHLLPVQPRHFRCGGQHGLRLGQDHLAAAFEVAEQTLAVAQAQVLLLVQQRLGGFQRFVVALLLEARAQFVIELGFLAAQLLDRGFGLFLETRLASVDMVEATRQFAREFDMRHLVFAHRHLGGAVDQDIRAHQQRIAEETVGGEILASSAFPAGPCRSARVPASPAA